MKKISFALVFCLFILLSVKAQKNKTASKNDGGLSIEINSDTEKLRLTVKGDIVFTDDDKSIQKISQGGIVEYSNKNNALNVVADVSGNPVYTINGNKKENFNPEDQKLIEECVQVMIENGAGVEGRFARLFKQGSPKVLAEIQRFKSDYVKTKYLSLLLQNANLSQQEMIDLLKKTDSYISSDYYKSELLDKIMASYLKNEATSSAFLETIRNMQSDYYQYQSINKLLAGASSENQFDAIISIVQAMKSDYYQAEVLGALLKDDNISDRRFLNAMKIASAMQSDYRQSQIISALLQKKSLNETKYAATIEAMQNVKSGFYQSEILKKLVNADIKDDKQWISLLQYSKRLDSDYYKSELLLLIAPRLPKNEKLKEEFNAAAKTITSDFYLGKVLRAL